MNYIVSESQISTLAFKLNSSKRFEEFQEKYDNLSEENKRIFHEILGYDFTDKRLINEAWWNTIGDIIGWIDPTGIIDFVNGLDYVRQGDYLFGFLSMVSAVPYVGDLVAKPMMAVAKSSKFTKGVDDALKIAKNAKTQDDMLKAQQLLSNASKNNSLVNKLLSNSVQWGAKLKDLVNKFPGGKLTSGLRKTINQWIDLFVNTLKRGPILQKASGRLAKQMTTDPKTAADLAKKIQEIQKASNRGLFSSYKLKDPGFMTKYFWPSFMWRTQKNRELIGLMRKTKFYAGFLDYLGLGNFVGPEELVNQIGEDQFNKSIKEYASTPEGQNYYSSDMSSIDNTGSSVSTQTLSSDTEGSDSSTQSSSGGFGQFINQMFGFT